VSSVPYAWSGHDDEGNVVTGSGSITLQAPPPTGLPFWGSSFQGNGDPTSLETFCGRALGLRRTYWNLTAAKVASSITEAKADAAKKRISWLSYDVATTDTWAAAAAGSADAEIEDLAARLETVPHEVWVALSHEPEGDGNLIDWRNMQRRLLAILAGVPNVKTSIITTGFDTWFSGNQAYSMDNLWPGSMCDIMGTDRYDPPTNNQGVDLKVTYDKIAADADRLGASAWAIAETGYTDVQAANDPDWLTRAFDDMKDHPVMPGDGLSYFNSTANSGTNTWPLGSGIKRDKFKACLLRSHALI
jgi:hypothetical protein